MTHIAAWPMSGISDREAASKTPVALCHSPHPRTADARRGVTVHLADSLKTLLSSSGLQNFNVHACLTSRTKLRTIRQGSQDSKS